MLPAVGLNSFILTYIVPHTNSISIVKVKAKEYRYRPRGFQEYKVPGFRDNGTGWW